LYGRQLYIHELNGLPSLEETFANCGVHAFSKGVFNNGPWFQWIEQFQRERSDVRLSFEGLRITGIVIVGSRHYQRPEGRAERMQNAQFDFPV
jgi:hypothetical protein